MASAAPVVLCPRFVFSSSEGVTLTEVERTLVCGDPKNPAWKAIPDNQAIFNLKTFLQARGRYNPKFEEKNHTIYIDAGKPRLAERFEVSGAPEELHPERMRHILGEVLTPSLLNTAAERLTARLRHIGYPCPEVKMSAGTEEGVLRAEVTAGPRLNLVKVEEDPIDGVLPGIMKRYYGFEIGQLYDEELLLLTRQRVLADAIVQGTFFETKCTPEGALAREKFIAGPPRIITVGFGANTESGPVVRASWKDSRLWRGGSGIEVAGTASYREQSIVSTSHWYALEEPSRFYLRPILTAKRQNEKSADTFTVQAQGAVATTWDWRTMGGQLAAGPKLNIVRTWRGEGVPSTEFITLGIDARLTDHTYELYGQSPRTGFDIRLQSDLSRHDWISSFDAALVRLVFQELWNPWKFDPPLFVVGIRGTIGVTATGEQVGSPRLPDTFKNRLGGSDSLRGFGRREIPGGAHSSGALTTAYLGVELRFADILPIGLQPVAFVDFGKAGFRPFSLDSPLYWSPGFGMRWQSPIGVMRATLAEGIIAGKGDTTTPTGLSFYFSFGEEF